MTEDTTDPYMGLHEGEMADELAEYEFNSMSTGELIETARESLLLEWRKQASERPEWVRERYLNLTGESQ